MGAEYTSFLAQLQFIYSMNVFKLLLSPYFSTKRREQSVVQLGIHLQAEGKAPLSRLLRGMRQVIAHRHRQILLTVYFYFSRAPKPSFFL